MTRNTILPLAIALIGILSVVVLKQRSTIETLRAERMATTVVTEPALQSPGFLPPEVPQAIEPAVSAPVVSQLPASVSAISSPPLAVVTTNRVEQEALEAHVQWLQSELEHIKRLVPEPEDASAAYVGPGMWGNVDPQTGGTKKIVITGEAKGHGDVSVMKIKGWGACMPMDCEWPEVPFYVLDRLDGARLYRRGFAVWEHESGNRTYLLITFEKSGLRIDKVRFRSGKSMPPYLVVERMIRLQ